MMVISTSGSCKLVLLFLVISILSISALAEGSDKHSVDISANKFLGEYLVNQSGFTLYYFSDDSKGDGASTCYDDCAAVWPPFYAGELTLPDSLRSVDFASITRTDGLKQTTFKGWPLYLSSKDFAAGDAFGNGQKGLWHVVNPADLPQLF
jgi:predicted lipoprotein with Yx(FWY)xxD motif